ncbi:hypothetical protein EWM64_g3976 [Hericium alpestre]|uniref:Uncharacterized protein n=1 Tax=Hericium alpestre TaxID=135208 RepID=A0A4Y9ZYX5_9AGAM|nr:hypothetical protein EWM64_g3976 [Hericium alpestre]
MRSLPTHTHQRILQPTLPLEEKGGTPVPRGSFGIGAPPQDDIPGGKSRELYGNRIAALGKGRPGAPSSFGRAVTAPLGSTLPDDIDGSSRPSSPDSATNSLSGAHRRNSSALNRRSVVDIMEQLNGVPPPPRKSRSVSESDSGPDVVIPPESILQTLEERSPVEDPALVSPPVKADSPPVKADSAQDSAAAPAKVAPAFPSPADEASPSKSSTPAVQMPPACTPVTKAHNLRVSLPKSMSPGSQPSQQSAAAVSTKTVSPSTSAPAVVDDSMDSTRGDISLDTSTAEIVTGVRTVISPTPVRAVEKDTIISKPVAATTTSPPISVVDTEEPVFTPTPTTNAKKGFTAVVHRPSTDNQESRPSTNVSRSGTVRSRPSSTNLKTNGDPHAPSVVRSKRQFKHLSNTVADPPASPSANDLSSLLKEAAWLEQQLTDAGISVGASEPLTLELGSSSLLSSKPTSTSTSASAPKSEPFPTQAPPDRLKTPPRRDSKSTVSQPTFQIDAPSATAGTDSTPGSPDTKASRTRRYFSLRNALRTVPGSWPRQSISSEMSSDDSAPVATPPSPTFTSSHRPDTRASMIK